MKAVVLKIVRDGLSCRLSADIKNGDTEKKRRLGCSKALLGR